MSTGEVRMNLDAFVAPMAMLAIIVVAFTIYHERHAQLDACLLPVDRVWIIARSVFEAAAFIAICAPTSYAGVAAGLGVLTIVLTLLAERSVGKEQEAGLHRAGAKPMAGFAHPRHLMLMA